MYNALLLSTILLLVANNADIDIMRDNSLIATSSDLAVNSIRNAELAGTDISDLVNNYNVALDLIDQAEKSKFDSCSSHEDCYEKAIKIFMQITVDADLLKEKGEMASSYAKLINIVVYSPVIAFATSIVGYTSFRAWKSNQVKRLLEMEIREK